MDSELFSCLSHSKKDCLSKEVCGTDLVRARSLSNDFYVDGECLLRVRQIEGTQTTFDDLQDQPCPDINLAQGGCGCTGGAGTGPVNPPESCSEGDAHVEIFEDCWIIWTCNGKGGWVYEMTVQKSSGCCTYFDVAQSVFFDETNPPTNPLNPNSCNEGDTFIEQYDNGIAYWTCNGTGKYVLDFFQAVAGDTLTSIVLSGTNIIYTDELGNATTLNLCAIVQSCETVTSLVDNGNSTFTYTNEDGVQTTINVIADTNTNTTYQLVDNNNGTITHAGSDGTNTVIDICSIISNSCSDTFIDNGDGTYTHTALDGTVVTITSAPSVVTPNGDGSFTHTSADGTVVTIDVCTLMNQGSCKPFITNNGDGTYTFDDGHGNTTMIDTVTVDGDINNVTINGSVVTFTNEDGSTTTMDICAIVGANCNATLVVNADGSLTHTANDGTVTNVPAPTYSTAASTNTNTNVQSVGTHTSGDGTTTTYSETVTSLVNNADGSATYTSEDGTETIIPADIVTTMVPNADGNLVYTNELGDTVVICQKDTVYRGKHCYEGELVCSFSDAHNISTINFTNASSATDNGLQADGWATDYNQFTLGGQFVDGEYIVLPDGASSTTVNPLFEEAGCVGNYMIAELLPDGTPNNRLLYTTENLLADKCYRLVVTAQNMQPIDLMVNTICNGGNGTDVPPNLSVVVDGTVVPETGFICSATPHTYIIEFEAATTGPQEIAIVGNVGVVGGNVIGICNVSIEDGGYPITRECLEGSFKETLDCDGNVLTSVKVDGDGNEFATAPVECDCPEYATQDYVNEYFVSDEATVAMAAAGNTSSLTKVVNADGTEALTHDDGTATTEDFCVGAVLTDEDGRSTTLNCTEKVLHRTLHIDNLHGGSVGPTTIGVSHADSDQTSVTGVTTRHDNTVLSGTNLTTSGNNTLAAAGQDLTNTGANAFAIGGLNNNNASTFGGILGGRDNVTFASSYTTIVGGRTNSVLGSYAGIYSGQTNTITGASNAASQRSAIVAGNQNTITDAQNAGIYSSDRSVITGGDNSVSVGSTLSDITGVTSGTYSSLRGTITGDRSAIVASEDVIISGAKSFAGASEFDNISGNNSATLATNRNVITGSSSAAIGAGRNTINTRDSGTFAHLRGLIDANESAIIGGEDGVTTANAARSVLHGGQFLNADQLDQNIMGAFNDPYGSATANRALIIGNGASGALRNSHVMTRLGEHYMYNNPGAPSANIDPTMGRIYVQGGALVYEGTAGTVTTLAPA